MTCGDWDLQNCLRREANSKKLKLPNYLKRWINIKKCYPLPEGREKAPGMAGLLKLSGLELEGR